MAEFASGMQLMPSKETLPFAANVFDRSYVLLDMLAESLGSTQSCESTAPDAPRPLLFCAFKYQPIQALVTPIQCVRWSSLASKYEDENRSSSSGRSSEKDRALALELELCGGA